MIDEQEGLLREELEAQRAELLPDRIEMKRHKGWRRRRGKMVCVPNEPFMPGPPGCPPGQIPVYTRR